MDTMKFKAVMDYEGYEERFGKDEWNVLMEPIMTDCYIKAYNYYAENFSYEPVNAEWDRIHPDIEKIEEGTPEWTAYNKFVAERASVWVETHINKKITFKDSIIRFYVDPEEVVFTGYDPKHPECKVRMHLEEI